MAEYVSKVKELEKKGILPSGILWGGLPTEEDLKRLGNYEVNSKLLLGELINQFEVVEPVKAKLVKKISGTANNMAGEVRFGNKFILVSSFTDEVTTERKREIKLIYFFLKSLRKQRTAQYEAVIAMQDNSTKKIPWRKKIVIGSGDQEAGAGDFILGCVIMPGKKLRQAESLGIRFLRFSIAVKKASKPRRSALRIRTENCSRDGKFTLLLPIEKIR
jgi:hypothetical protein